MDERRSDTLVVFGATGDLAGRKLLPAIYRLAVRGHLDVPVVGVARSPLSNDAFRKRARAALASASPEAVDSGRYEEFARALSYVSGDYADPSLYERLAERLSNAQRPIFYLAIHPDQFPGVVRGLARVGLQPDGRVVLEKPFGRDLASARA